MTGVDAAISTAQEHPGALSPAFAAVHRCAFVDDRRSVTKLADRGKVYSGTYFYNFELSSFAPDGTDESWCPNGDMRQAELPAKGSGNASGTAHVVLQGKLSPPGHYCNLDAARHVLTVDRALKIGDTHAAEP